MKLLVVVNKTQFYLINTRCGTYHTHIQHIFNQNWASKVALEKMIQRKIIFGQHKKYGLFLEILFQYALFVSMIIFFRKVIFQKAFSIKLFHFPMFGSNRK